MSEYTAKALIEPRDYRVVFVIQKAGVMPPITPVLHSSLLYSYRCSVYLFAAMRSAMSKKIFALLRLEDTAARLFLLPHLL